MERAAFVKDKNKQEKSDKDKKFYPGIVARFPVAVYCFRSSTSFTYLSKKGLIRSIGTGNMIVEFFSVAISVSV